MSVQKLIYGEFVTDSLITALTNDAAATSLIRELNHHYGLQVIDHKHEHQLVGAEIHVPTFYLVDKNGFAQGHAYAWEEDSKTHTRTSHLIRPKNVASLTNTVIRGLVTNYLR